jgi:hypothetical protein
LPTFSADSLPDVPPGDPGFDIINYGFRLLPVSVLCFDRSLFEYLDTLCPAIYDQPGKSEGPEADYLPGSNSGKRDHPEQ